MTDTERAFQERLDAEPDNNYLRMVFADYLDDIDDPRAAGYRELGRSRVCPYRTRHWTYANYNVPRTTDRSALPRQWWAAVKESAAGLEVEDTGGGEEYACWESRRAADDAAALAYAALSPAERREIAGAHEKEAAAPVIRPVRRGRKGAAGQA